MHRITIKDVAQRAGVSTTTASFALNNVTDRVSAKTRSNVLKTAKELGYVPNTNASKLRKNVSDNLMLVYSQVFLEEQNASTTRFILGVLSATKKIKKDVIIKSFSPYEDWDVMIQSYAHLWASRKVDGIIFFCAVDDNVPDYVFSKLYNEYGVNLVNATAPAKANELQKDYPIVYDDSYNAVQNALEFITNEKFKEIYYIGMDYKNFYPIRYQSYLDYMKKTDAIGKLLTYNSIYRSYDEIWNLIQPCLEKQNKDIAFMCWNDVDAITVLELLRIKEINSKYRIGVIGYDDIPTASHTTPAITTISTPHDIIAKHCVKTVCDNFENRPAKPQNIVVDAKFIRRKSL